MSPLKRAQPVEHDNPLVRSGKVRKHRDRESAPTIPPPIPLAAVPHRMMDEVEILTLPIDHRAGFVLAHVDGSTSVRTIIDISGMPQEEVTGVVDRLLALGAIALT